MSPRWVLLSDGARPTEAIYFQDSAGASLRAAGIGVTRRSARRWRGPLARGILGPRRGSHLLICRSLEAGWLAYVQRHRYRFGQIVYLIDDDIPAAAADERLPQPYRVRMQRLAAQQPQLLELADEVVAGSAVLGQRLQAEHAFVSVLNPPMVAPLPARAHLDAGPAAQAPWTIGFHGTRAHQGDLAAIAPALVRLHEQRSDVRLEVMLGQYTPAELASLPRVNTPDPLPWNHFQRYLARHRVHIGLAPLQPTPFNRAKSFIKFFDIAAMGGVGLYSRRPPYTEVVQDGVDGLLVGDEPAAWYAALEELLANPAKTRWMAANAARKAALVGDPSRVVDFWQARTRGDWPLKPSR